MRANIPACAAFLLTAVAWGQDSPPVFHADAELVLLDVQVLHNKTKTAAAGLQAKDFELFEDGVRQKITVFGRDQFPLSIVFLLDLTDSVRGVLPGLAAGAKNMLAHLKPEDEVAVMVYAASARVVDGLTTDRQRTADALARAAKMKSDEAAYFNESVYQAAAQLQTAHDPSSRRVILWLTDNFANAPSPSHNQHDAASLEGQPPHTEEQAIRALHESGTVVTALLVKDPLAVPWVEVAMLFEASARHKYPAGDARKYAEVTGGVAFTRGGKNVEDRLAEIIDDLRSRYTIGYRPSEAKAPGTFCRLRVDLAPNGPLRPKEWTVLARSGYYRK